MLRIIFQYIAVSAVLASTTTTSLAAAKKEKSNDDQQQCGMYMAISSTSTVDDTKWGLYAGQDIPKDSPIGYPDIAINIFNLQGNAHLADESEDSLSLVANTVEFFEQFIWVPLPSGGAFELEDGRAVTAIPGAGVLGGFNPKLTNADWNHTSAYFRPALGEQPKVNHPGRGAYTNFFNVGLRSKEEIQAGREIFLDYGENWESEAEEEELTAEDFKKIDATIVKMSAFFEKYKGDLDEKARVDIYDFLIRDVMGAAAGSAKGKKIMDLLPSYPEVLPKVTESGGSLAYSQPKSTRDQEWLQAHGRCIDNIRPGASSIPDAGRGAFSTRKLKKGGLVTPVPLVQLPASSLVNMHEIGQTEEDHEDGPVYYRLSDEVQDEQLLLNYCYGHRDSGMLFFPSGTISSLINHSKKPNSKMVWSSHPAHQRHWYDMSPAELLSQETMYIGLLIEIVALRDIKEGEEVTIDYGADWAEAWDEHVKQWKAKVAEGTLSKEWPIRALDFNEEYKGKVFKNPEEITEEPYPENLMLKCFVQVSANAAGAKVASKAVRDWAEPPSGTFDSDTLEDCVITDYVEVNDGTAGPMPFNYTVSLLKGTETTIVANVPHRAFVFVDKPGTGDQFTPDAFRHYIAIPDDVFPEGPWRDLVNDEEESA